MACAPLGLGLCVSLVHHRVFRLTDEGSDMKLESFLRFQSFRLMR